MIEVIGVLIYLAVGVLVTTLVCLAGGYNHYIFQKRSFEHERLEYHNSVSHDIKKFLTNVLRPRTYFVMTFFYPVLIWPFIWIFILDVWRD